MSYPSSPRQNSSGYWRASYDRCVSLILCTAPGVKKNVPRLEVFTHYDDADIIRNWRIVPALVLSLWSLAVMNLYGIVICRCLHSF